MFKLIVLLSGIVISFFSYSSKFSMFDMEIDNQRIMRLNLECSNYIEDTSKKNIHKLYGDLLLGLAVGKVEGYKLTFDNYLHHEHLFSVEFYQKGYSAGKIDLYSKLNAVSVLAAKNHLYTDSKCLKEIDSYKKLINGREFREIYYSLETPL